MSAPTPQLHNITSPKADSLQPNADCKISALAKLARVQNYLLGTHPFQNCDLLTAAERMAANVIVFRAKMQVLAEVAA